MLNRTGKTVQDFTCLLPVYDFVFPRPKQKKSQRLNSVKNTGNHFLECVCLTAKDSAGSRKTNG